MIQRQLLLRLPDDEGPVSYVLQDSAGNLLMSGVGGLDKVAGLAGSVPVPAVRVLAPGTRVRVDWSEVAARGREAEGDMHRVAAPAWGDEKAPVAEVARDWMDGWVRRLADAGIHPLAMVPETTVLPADDQGGWLLWLEDDRAWLNTGSGRGIVLERGRAAEGVLDHLASSDGGQGPRRLLVVRHGSEWETDRALHVPDAFGRLPVERQVSEESLLEIIGREMPGQEPLNLLTGPYGRRRPGRFRVLGRFAVIVVVLWAGVHLIQVHTEIRYKEHEQTILEDRIREIYRSAHGVREVGQPRRDMEAALVDLTRDTTGSAGEFHDALARLAPLMVDTPDLRVQTLDYRPGSLDLELRHHRAESPERLRQRIPYTDGWSVEITQTRATDGHAYSSVQLRRAGP
ncbi:hypothetical protein B1C78_13000 [Thioalkalivibrio denitrificans]|uniref:Type II secretion system protein L n=1 Tax=Thioalkalivibrio denitrificans TaxID=108003 RepID=A0A1V3ND26_9GAMM|nr:type II secretion system protein GspL [Thioalkalivibrio denitrificans]OOG22970.1 hypothetical protein B1C78_13000 [Thioalkalivibrio denitrificans]